MAAHFHLEFWLAVATAGPVLMLSLTVAAADLRVITHAYRTPDLLTGYPRWSWKQQHEARLLKAFLRLWTAASVIALVGILALAVPTALALFSIAYEQDELNLGMVTWCFAVGITAVVVDAISIGALRARLARQEHDDSPREER
jgi:hypothetical protein